LCAVPCVHGSLENPPPTFNLVSGVTVLDKPEKWKYQQCNREEGLKRFVWTVEMSAGSDVAVVLQSVRSGPVSGVADTGWVMRHFQW
jgi:hypothetical protein